MMAACNKLLFATIILSFVSYICTVAFNALSAVAQKGLFYTTASNISDKYSLDVTPAGWTFSIWSVIYIWNGIWIIYAVSTLFRRNTQDYVYINPGIHSLDFFVLWITNNIINIGWLFLWDREYLVFSNVLLALIPITCFMMLQKSYRSCYQHGAQLSENHKVDLWCTRILVHNGLAMYATWTSIATVINFGIVLKYKILVQDPDVSSMVLCLIFLALVLWFLMETFVFEKYVRYTFTIYPVAIVASVGVYFGREQSTPSTETDILNVVLIVVSSVACLLRFVLIFTCDKIRPLFSEKNLHMTKENMHVTKEDSQINGHTNSVALEMIDS